MKCSNIILKKILFLILVLLVIYYISLGNNFNKRSLSQSQILGFQINGIGNGHMTQAQTVYNILIEKYKIPIIIIYGKNKECDNVFPQSKIIYHKISSTEESINNMNYIKGVKDIISLKPSKKYENEYGINKWFNFCISDLFNYRTNQILIASQFSIDDIRMDLLINTTKILSNVTFISIHIPSKYCKYTIPPLINLEKIERKNVNKKLLLAYSTCGQNFSKHLNYLAEKNSSYRFKYFTNTKLKEKLSKNITIYKPDKIKFKRYLKICGAVLCTSGNELVYECTYNCIPSAIMPCSNKHFEQVHNCKKYVENLKYSEPLSKSLDLKYLVNKNMEQSNLSMIKCLEKRDEKVLKLCNI